MPYFIKSLGHIKKKKQQINNKKKKTKTKKTRDLRGGYALKAVFIL